MVPRLALGLLTAALLTGACSASTTSPSPTQLGSVASPTTSSTAAPTASQSSGPSPKPSAAPPLGTLIGNIDSGRILITIEGDGETRLAYVDPTGLHEVATDADVTMAHAVWGSHDSIVFDSERAGRRHLFRMTISNGQVTQLTTNVGQEQASVSIDGRVVSGNYDPTANNRDLGLQIWSATGRPVAAVTPSGDPAGVTGAAWPAFSPDGRSIAYVQMTDFDAERGAIFLVDATGGEPRRLTPDADHIAYPRWSPDGRSILFTQSAASGQAGGPLMLIDTASGDVRPLVDPGQGSVAFNGDWSPDGTQIAYQYWNSGLEQNQLWIASSDGTHQRALWVGNTAGVETPDWGP